ncbi:hypothetical protein [Hansschlegelia zhihuaiae]|uniref:Alpha/beta hydrolase n=1 Tax=Hansschlegelia zhihuaiae TaxID=405005 RepID=A0A4Q0MNF2_9HYPH|nr:hypothetical protein [Hansschlegelia zhihuaiae]RXF75035.1 hypothetical protein EK403_03010 [Hansschlegelia zhihuaiae]
MFGRLLRLAVLAGAAALSVAWITKAEAAEGPFAVTTGSYKFVARDEPLVATDRKVDLWGEVYRPKDLARGPFPLLLFLHGNHGTCGIYDAERGVRVDNRSDYTTTGECPGKYVVTPNHLGYAYLAEELASWGYVVVSINANRGVTAGAGLPDDRGLNLMRGRLILRNLALLSDWNRGSGAIEAPDSLGFDPKGVMDFSQVGLMGHSRGGEGARAALQQFRDEGSPFAGMIEPMTIRSIFEIGPVDGQTSRVLDANGVNSMILLPTCDGDVYNLQGMKVFDRVFSRGEPVDDVKAFHGTFAVWGANHNAYNTEWLTSDSPGCYGANQIFPASGRSLPQQTTAKETIIPFFRATVGPNANPSLANRFDPAVQLPDVLTDLTKYDRGYLPRPINAETVVLERFTNVSGLSDAGVPTTAVGLRVSHQAASYEHDPSVRVAEVNWDQASAKERYFQVNLAPEGRDLSAFKTFAFRVALRCFQNICKKLPTDKGEMNLTVALADATGATSNEIRVGARVRISRPIGPAFYDENDTNRYLHGTLYTVEIPLQDFDVVNLAAITGVRFRFERKPAGLVDISDLTATTQLPALPQVAALAEMSSTSSAGFAPAPKLAAAPTAGADGNRLKIVRSKAPAAPRAAKGGGATVDIVLSSKRSFPVTGALPKLTVGDQTVEGGTPSPDGKTLTITVPAKTFNGLKDGADVSLFLQASSPTWKFGPLAK